MMVRFTQRVTIYSLKIVLYGALILTALYVSIGRIVVNAVEHYKTELTDFLESSLRIEVSMDKIEGSWSYLDPGITIENLVIGPAAEPAVVIDRISLSISSLFSLLEGTFVPTDIDVDGLRLTVEERNDGSWLVRGLPTSDQVIKFQGILDSANHLEEVTLRGLQLVLAGQQSTVRISSVEGIPMQILRQAGVRTLSFPLVIEKLSEGGEAEGTMVHLSGKYDGSLRNMKSVSANFYFKLPQVQLADFLPGVGFLDFELVSAQADAEFWLDYSHEELSLVGKANAHMVKLTDGHDQFTFLDNINTKFKLVGSISEGSFQVFLPEINIDIAGESITLADVNLVVEESDGNYIVGGNIPLMDLGKIKDAVITLNERVNLMPARGLAAFSTMNPRGSIENTTFFVDLSRDTPDIKITSDIRGVSIEAYLGAPAISSLDGFVSLRPDRGYIDINNSAYSMHFASMFAKPWPLESARGRINYQSRDGVIRFSSGLLELTKGELSAYGKVQVNLPPNREDQTWGLIVGINEAELLDASRYLPNTLSGDFLAWINRSVLKGHGSETAVIFHGSLFRDAPKIRKVFGLYIKVEDATLDYDNNWPKITELEATIYVDNGGVFSDNALGKVMNSRITRSIIDVPIPLNGRIDNVHIEARLTGPLSDGISVLNDTPLAETTNHIAEKWSGTGQMSVDAIINIPLGPRSGEEPFTDITVTLDNNDLTMPDFDLTLYSIKGDIDYENLSGLSSSGFSAVLFNEPIVGSIKSAIVDQSGEIIIKASGRVDMRDLYDWSDQVLLTATAGTLGYAAEIHVPFGGKKDRSYVELKSDLKGVTIEMPAPMKKESADSELELSYRQIFLDSGFRVNFNLSDNVDGAVQIKDGIVSGGQVHFGKGSLGAVSYDTLKVTGEIGQVYYEEWDRFLETLDRFSDVALESEMARSLDDIVIDVGLLDIYSFELPQTKVRITRGESSWKIGLENKNLSGTVIVPDEDGLPVDLQFSYLRFFEEDYESSADEDPFVDVIPQEMPAVDFATDELTIYGEDYGSWKFDFRPNDTGATLDNLTAEVKGMSILDPSRAFWTYTDGVHSSGYEGVVSTADLGYALEEWGYASSVEGTDFKFTSNFGWPGSPAMVEMEIVEGTLQIRGGKGKFVQADSSTAALKLLGIFDFSQLARRFMLDFSDVIDEGYAFDKIRGMVTFDTGIVQVAEPIIIEGPGSNFKVGGTVNLLTSELSGDVIVTLPVGKSLPWYAAYSAIATGPLVGAGVFLVQKVFEDQINQMSSAKYEITGSIDEPVIKFNALFDDTVREASQTEEAVGEVAEDGVGEQAGG